MIDKVKALWKDIGDELGGIEYRDESSEIVTKNSTQCDKFKCNFLWQRMVILWNGDIYPCLFHGVKDNRDILLGNIKDSSIKELWNSKKMNELRQLHIQGRANEISSCENCSYRNTELEKILKL